MALFSDSDKAEWFRSHADTGISTHELVSGSKWLEHEQFVKYIPYTHFIKIDEAESSTGEFSVKAGKFSDSETQLKNEF